MILESCEFEERSVGPSKDPGIDHLVKTVDDKLISSLYAKVGRPSYEKPEEIGILAEVVEAGVQSRQEKICPIRRDSGIWCNGQGYIDETKGLLTAPT